MKCSKNLDIKKKFFFNRFKFVFLNQKKSKFVLNSVLGIFNANSNAIEKIKRYKKWLVWLGGAINGYEMNCYKLHI